MDSMMGLMDLLFAGAGVYVLYAWYLMKTKGEIKESLLMGKDIQLRKCKDLEGYKAFIGPKLLIFGIATVLYGGFGLLNDYVMAMPGFATAAVMLLFLVALIWFAVSAKKGIKLFW